MTRHLTKDNLQAVCELLDGWYGPLTWELLVRGIEATLGHRYTRQTLVSHERIRLAYKVQKALSTSEPMKRIEGSPGFVAISDRLARVSSENARLRLENERLLGQFVIWAYNASIHGMTESQLNRSLPVADRERTRI